MVLKNAHPLLISPFIRKQPFTTLYTLHKKKVKLQHNIACICICPSSPPAINNMCSPGVTSTNHLTNRPEGVSLSQQRYCYCVHHVHVHAGVYKLVNLIIRHTFVDNWISLQTELPGSATKPQLIILMYINVHRATP